MLMNICTNTVRNVFLLECMFIILSDIPLLITGLWAFQVFLQLNNLNTHLKMFI